MHKYLVLGLLSIGTLSALSSVSADEGRMTLRNANGSVLSGATLECVRTSVATREASVRSAYVTMTTATLGALDTRTAALNESWMKTDRTERKTSRDAAWSTWKSTSKTIRETFRSAKKSAWEAYKTQVSACKVSRSDIEPANAQMSDVQ